MGTNAPGARANGAAGPQGERHGMARVIEPLLFGSIPLQMQLRQILETKSVLLEAIPEDAVERVTQECLVAID